MAGIRDTSDRYYSRLPGVGRPGPWITYAACKGKPAAWFFPTVRVSEPSSYSKGKEVCALCSVREECLEDALDRKEAVGLWGGLAPWELQAMLRIRARQRGSPARTA